MISFQTTVNPRIVTTYRDSYVCQARKKAAKKQLDSEKFAWYSCIFCSNNRAISLSYDRCLDERSIEDRQSSLVATCRARFREHAKKYDIDGNTSVKQRCTERVERNERKRVKKRKEREYKKGKREAFMEIQRKRSTRLGRLQRRVSCGSI